MPILETALAGLALVLAVPSAMLLLECVAAALVDADRGEDPALARAARPPVVVLMPAHDEADGIGAALAGLRAQLAPGDRLLVVADNCRDATARRAREAGAEVLERADPTRRGKGFALAHGLARLAVECPDAVVVIVDADCRCEPGSVEALARSVVAHGAPAQACYLLAAPRTASPGAALSAFALLLRNRVRPLGLAALGLPCPLFGSGMAAPVELLARHPQRGASLVEDLELGIDLAVAGHAPRFVPGARVTSVLPADREAARGQRRRWEHGHLQALARGVPRLLAAALRRRRLAPLALGLDLWIPPLSLLVLAEVGLALAGLLRIAAGGSAASLVAALACLAATGAAVALAWARFGRQVASASQLLRAPAYALGKLPVYVGFLLRRQREWVRTRRDG